jgi:hypothetical protein
MRRDRSILLFKLLRVVYPRKVLIAVYMSLLASPAIKIHEQKNMQHKNLCTEGISMNRLMNVSSILLLLLCVDVHAMQNQEEQMQLQMPTMKEKVEAFEKKCSEEAAQRRENAKIKKDDEKSIYSTLLLNHGLHPLEKYKEMAADGFDFKQADDEGWALLHKAAEQKDLPLIKWLIEEQKVDINALCAQWVTRGPLAKTPLDFIVDTFDERSNNDLEVISYLTKHGAQFSGRWSGARSNMKNPRVLKTYVAALPTKKKLSFCRKLEMAKKDECPNALLSWLGIGNDSAQCKDIQESIAILEQSLQ